MIVSLLFCIGTYSSICDVISGLQGASEESGTHRQEYVCVCVCVCELTVGTHLSVNGYC